MKAAIYINEGTTQVVLTPENEWEKNALKMLNSSEKVQSYYGQFYECQGGWYRHTDYESAKESLIFRIDRKMEIPAETL